MTAPHRDDLEHRLAELFQQRAGTVTRARPVDFGSGEGKGAGKGTGTGTGKTPTGPTQIRLGTRRQNLGVLAAAAAVFVAIAATVLGIQASQQQPAPPLATGSHSVSTPTASPTGEPTADPTDPPTDQPTGQPKDTACPAPASWRQAIAGATVPVDRRLNTVLSANGATGDYLVVQGNEPEAQTSAVYSDVELALFHGAQGRTVYTPGDSSDIPQAHPTGAITADWVAFAVAHPQNLHYSYKVMLYDRRSGQVTTLAESTDQLLVTGKSFIGSPVIAAGKVYWLTTTFNKPASTTLDSWDLARGAGAGSRPAANATELISYGSGMIVSYGLSDQPGYPLQTRTALRNAAGQPLSEVQLAAAAQGTNFGYDGDRTLSWWRHDGNSIGYSSVKVGTSGVRSDAAIRHYAGAGVAAFPFTQLDVNGSPNGLIDLRTRALVALPDGVSLQAVAGETVIFGTATGKAGAQGLSTVPLSALPAVRC